MSALSVSFNGFDEEHDGAVVMKGPFGAKYRLAIDEAATAPFSHASFVRNRSNGRIAVVIGSSEGRLFVQYLGDVQATGIQQSEAVTNLESHGPVGDATYEGPLGFSYTFDTKQLDDVFDVRPGVQHYLKLWESTATFVGVLLGVPWVRIIKGAPRSSKKGLHCAVPLVGCHNGDALRSLYALCDVPDTNGALMSTPRTHPTPRSAGSSGAAYRLIPAKHKAICCAPFGVSLEADTKDSVMKIFGVRSGDRLLSLRGESAGKLVTAVGVSAGTLLVHVDGNSKVTLVRGCFNGDDLASQFARPKGGEGLTTSSAISATKITTAPVLQVTPASVRAPAVNDHQSAPSTTPSSPRSSGVRPFRCWTAFGRYEFNTSTSSIQKFGNFAHGTSLQCTSGTDTGKIFHVVGERSGLLWVIESTKLRAMPLTHCATSADVESRYGFTAVGKVSLKSHDERETEPPPTPFHSPRGRSCSQREHSAESSPQTIASVSGAPTDSKPPIVPALPIVSALPRSVAVPPIKGMELTRQLEPAFTAEAIADSMTALGDVQPTSSTSPKPSSVEAHTSDDGKVPSAAHSSGQSARNYLKAVAMFMLGTTNPNRSPLPFHEYYAVDPTQRIGAALRKLPDTKQAWVRVHPTKPYSEATVEDLLRLLAKFPQLLP